MATKQPARVSNNPESFVQGGLINDVDVEIVSASYVMWDYDGRLKDRQLAVHCELKNLDTDEVIENYWSAGKDFEPADDEGAFVKPTGAATQLRKGSNWHAFLTSLVNNAGMPAGALDGEHGIKALEGSRMHVVRVPAPERVGLEQRKDAPKQTILICSALISWPWDKGKGAKRTTTRAAGAAPSATAAEGSDDFAADVLARLTTAVDKAGGTLKLAQAKVAVFQSFGPNTKTDVRTKAVSLIGDENWLAERNFMVDGDQLVKV